MVLAKVLSSTLLGVDAHAGADLLAVVLGVHDLGDGVAQDVLVVNGGEAGNGRRDAQPVVAVMRW